MDSFHDEDPILLCGPNLAGSLVADEVGDAIPVLISPVGVTLMEPQLGVLPLAGYNPVGHLDEAETK